MKRLPALLVLAALPAAAHEVQMTRSEVPLTVLTLRYADGKPFAYEQFEVTPAGGEAPVQVGRTDAQGRAAILPAPGKALEFVATTRDGHGARLTLPPAAEPTAAGTVSAAPPAPTLEAPPRALWIAAGAGLLFGLFGLVQLFIRQRKSKP